MECGEVRRVGRRGDNVRRAVQNSQYLSDSKSIWALTFPELQGALIWRSFVVATLANVHGLQFAAANPLPRSTSSI